MPSVFKSSFGDSLSGDSSIDNAQTSNDGPGPSINEDVKGSMPTGSSSPQLQNAGSVARSEASGFQLPSLQPHQHTSLFYLSLVEGRCKTQAANSINAARRSGEELPDDHPEVCELAQHLFAEMSRELSRAGVLPAEFAGNHLSELRARYLSSFDAALSTAASRHPLETSGNDGRKITRSDMLTLQGDASSPRFGTSTALASISFAMAPITNLFQGGEHEHVAGLMMGSNQNLFATHSPYETEYKELSLLGEGGFGRVTRVLNILDNQEYAVKRIIITKRLGKVTDATQLEALLAEIRTLARLSHTNIVRYHHAWLEKLTLSASSKATSSQGLLSAPLVGQGPRTPSFSDETRLPHRRNRRQEMEHELNSGMVGDLQMYDALTDDDYDDGIVFGYDSTSQDRTSSQFPNPYSRHSHEMTATSTLRSSVHSMTADRNEVADEEISRTGFWQDGTSARSESPELPTVPTMLVQSQVESDIAIFIKMSLHPLTLADYISTDPIAPGEKITTRHCFHTAASIQIFSTILDGVEYLHSQRIVHRDLKPTNIFLSVHEHRKPFLSGCVEVTSCSQCKATEPQKSVFITPCIGDFGLIAEIKEPGPGTPATSSCQETYQPSLLSELTPSPVGTQYYRAPASSVICQKMDIYSLGITLFELVYKIRTRSERVVVLDKLSEGVFPNDFDKPEMLLGIKSMLCADREERWDCAAVREWIADLLKKQQ